MPIPNSGFFRLPDPQIEADSRINGIGLYRTDTYPREVFAARGRGIQGSRRAAGDMKR